MVKLDFLGVGAMKAATSWMYVCFDEHPEIFVPIGKEVNFFSYHYQRGYDWYQALFQDIHNEKIAGEISPSYMTDPEVPKRIFQWNPDIKLIFLLRNPLERAYSHYCMDLRMGKVSDNIEQEIDAFASQSCYYSYIKNYLNLFPRNQILILLQEDVRNRPSETLINIFEFLGVNPEYKPQSIHRTYFQRKPKPKYQKIYTWVYRRKESNIAGKGFISRVYFFLQRIGLIDSLHNVIPEQGYPTMSREKALQLIRNYESDVVLLSKLLGRDLSSWLTLGSDFKGIQNSGIH